MLHIGQFAGGGDTQSSGFIAAYDLRPSDRVRLWVEIPGARMMLAWKLAAQVPF
jgi:hypothetical protein